MIVIMETNILDYMIGLHDGDRSTSSSHKNEVLRISKVNYLLILFFTIIFLKAIFRQIYLY